MKDKWRKGKQDHYMSPTPEERQARPLHVPYTLYLSPALEIRRDKLPTPVFLGFPCGSAGKESACNAGDLDSIPGLGRSPGEGKGYPLQYSGLENSMDRIVYGVAKSRTQLSNFHWRFYGKHFTAVHGDQSPGLSIQVGKKGRDSEIRQGWMRRAPAGNHSGL